MSLIKVNIAVYGPLAKQIGGKHVVQLDLEIESGSCTADLLSLLGISAEDRSYVMINSVLSEVPGLSTGRGETLQDDDHVGVFSKGHMWPYQYRDGIPMTESLKKVLLEHGVMHHSYLEVLPDSDNQNVSSQQKGSSEG